jgi:hypothetical protein
LADSRVRLKNTNPEVLIGNLRGEVGEAITNWIILRQLIGTANHLQTDDVVADMKNDDLAFINAVRERISNDLVLTLAELSEPKIGQTTFYFASEKLGKLKDEVQEFRRFIVVNKLKEKRNREIAHREQPEEWPKKGDIRITYLTLTVAVAKAIRLMKKIDSEFMGNKAFAKWQKMRAMRYDLAMPARAKYLLLPHMVG